MDSFKTSTPKPLKVHLEHKIKITCSYLSGDAWWISSAITKSQLDSSRQVGLTCEYACNLKLVLSTLHPGILSLYTVLYSNVMQSSTAMHSYFS